MDKIEVIEVDGGLSIKIPKERITPDTLEFIEHLLDSEEKENYAMSQALMEEMEKIFDPSKRISEVAATMDGMIKMLNATCQTNPISPEKLN